MSITTKGIRWGYGIQGSMATVAATSAGGLRVRREGGLPDFKPGMTPVDAAIYQGRWGRSDNELLTGNIEPVFSWPTLLTPGMIKLLLDQVMTPTPAGSGFTYALQAAPGCTPSATKFLSIFRKNDLITAKDKSLVGSVVKSIKLSGSSSQQRVNMDVELLAYDMTTTGTVTGTFTAPTENFLLHSGLVFQIAALATKVAEWDLTIEFNTTRILDNATKAAEFILGEFDVTGNVRAPYVDDDVYNDFMGQVSNTLTFKWGTAASSGYLLFTIPVKYNEPDEDQGDGNRLRQGVAWRLAETDGQAFTVALQV